MIELPELYQHQSEQTDRVRAALAKHRRVILTAPPGVGKTRMSKWILGAALNREPGANASGKYLWTVHRRGLVDNAIGSFEEHPELPHGIIMSGEETAYGQRVQVASIDSLLSWFIENDHYRPDITFDLLVMDETHAHLPKFARFLQYHDAKREELGLHQAFVIGLTATAQAPGLADVYKSIEPGPATQWLIDNKFLSPFRYFRATEGKLDLLVKRGDRFTDESQDKAMGGLGGDLVRDWRRLAEGRPTIGFFPLRSHAKAAAHVLSEAGIRTAYVDGETPDDDRRSMFRDLNEGHLDYLCNVQVVERGTDIPAASCIQVCVAIASIVRWRQIIGRGSRVHPSKSDCCVARGTPILTDRGLVPIEEVTLRDRVWDGRDWCCHSGPCCNGIKEVIEWCGLLLTPDHKVLTNDGWKTAEAAKSGGWGAVVGGVGGSPIWAADDSNPHDSRRQSETGSGGGLRTLRETRMEILPQDFQTTASRMRALYAEVWAALSGMGLASRSTSTTAVPMPADHVLFSLWRAWNRVSVCLNLRRRMLGRGESWVAPGQVMDARPDRKRWSLRTWQLTLGDVANAIPQSRLCMAGQATAAVPVCDVLRWATLQSSAARTDGEGDSRQMVAEVWDIQNVGPRNRYCANGVIIANCILDHAGNLKRGLGFFEDDPPWSLDVTVRDPGEAGIRPTIECPRCSAIYRGGLCRSCGYEPQPSERRAQGLEFDGKELIEIKRREKKQSVKTAEELMVSALYMAGRSGRTWRQAVGIFKGLCRKQGANYRVPKTIGVGEHRYAMLRYGSVDSSRRVAAIYPFTVGKHGGDYVVAAREPAESLY